MSTPPAVVYRAWAADDRLLYIGSTKNWARRLVQHKRSPWYPDAVRFTTDEYPTIEAARAAETKAIDRERAYWNNHGRYDSECNCRRCDAQREQIEAYVSRIVAKAPPLTGAQRARLARLLLTAGSGDAA